MRKNIGFTLIEMLIVISIICILAAMMVGIVSSAQSKARRNNTDAAILQIKDACEKYRIITQTYPRLDSLARPASPPAAYTDAIVYNAASMIKCNKRIRYIMEEIELSETGGPAWSQKRHDPLIEQSLLKMTDTDGVPMYMDAFGFPLRVWWGRDHKGDTPTGPPNYKATVDRWRYAPDIYSMGENKKDDIAIDADSTEFVTILNFTGSNPIDDRVSWQQDAAK